MKYILDFDHTLLDTDAFVNQVTVDEKLKDLIIPEIWKQYNVHNFLYEDVLEWLKSKTPQNLHILTAWTPDLGLQAEAFQREKILSGKFDKLVSSITFVVGEKGKAAAEIASQFPPREPIVFVDDRIEQCLSVKKSIPRAICCLMIRNHSTNHDVREKGDLIVVNTLWDIDDIIRKI